MTDSANQIEFAGFMKLMTRAELLELMAEQIARYVHLRGHLPAKAEEINRALAEIRAVDPVKKYGLVAFET